MRRLLFVSLGLLAGMVVGSATPALADSGVIKGIFIEDFQGTMPLDDPTFTACLGYEGQLFEDRDGVFHITVHTRGAMADAFHVEGEVTATFVISPVEGTGVVYTGTYREHAAGNFMTIDDQDVEYPAGSFYLHATGTGSDGSSIRFTLHGHSTIDKRTGEVRREIQTATCRVS
jgi:hypothetical protein